MDSQIDLRDYIDAVLSRWKWVVGIVLGIVVCAAIVSFWILTPQYSAVAGVVIVKSKSEIAFEPMYRTLSEEDLGRSADQTAARRQALVALGKSGVVAAEVIGRMGSVLAPNERSVPTLLQMVQVQSDGELISIRAEADDPQKAVAVANAWGEVYEDWVNELYSGRAQSLESVQAQVSEAKQQYEGAEDALASFVGDNRIDVLAREIAAKEEVIASLEEAQTEAGTAAYRQQLDTKRLMLETLYADLQQLEGLLADATSLHAQLQSKVSSSAAALGDTLAVIFLRAKAFSSSAELPVQLQLSVTGPMEEQSRQQVEDVAGLIATLEARQDETQSRIAALSSQLLDSTYYELVPAPDDPISRQITEYAEDVLVLKEQLEREKAKHQELTKARDLALETYEALARKEAETGIAAQVTDTEVRFAVPAYPSDEPVAPRRVLNVAVAAALGLVLAVAVAFFAEFWTRAK